jgi:hypothetical protein
MNANGVTYSCMCNNQIKKETAFFFLEDLKNLFLQTFPQEQINNANTFTLNEQFRENMKNRMVI